MTRPVVLRAPLSGSEGLPRCSDELPPRSAHPTFARAQVTAAELREADVTLDAIKARGYTADEARKGGFSPVELYHANWWLHTS